MAVPLTADKLLAILKAEGVKTAEYPGWRTRERDDETGKTFGPVHMVLNHHTAGKDSRDVVARDGVPGLPAPLAHIHLAKSGLATMCSAGRANHAGLMAANAYHSFLNEATTHPAPSRSSGTIDGNDVSYGIETENRGDGKDVYPRAQYDAWVRINAAFCRHYGWSAQSCGCHKETSVEGKVDPRGPVEGYGTRGRFEYTPSQFRKDVAERLKHAASWSPSTATPAPATSAPAPAPATEQRLPALEKPSPSRASASLPSNPSEVPMAAPVEKKVIAATAGTYVSGTALLAGLEAVQDHHELVGWMPAGLSPFVLALVPAAISFVSGWAARHTPRGPGGV